MFAVFESLLDAMCFRFGFYTQTDGLSFSEFWVAGFFVAFSVHWQKSKRKFKS